MTPRFLAIATIAASLAVPALAAQDSDQNNNLDPKSLSSQQVKDVQQALKDKGNLHGQVDGVWGPQSARALKSFQKGQNMEGTKGQIDDQTISALGLNQSEFQNADSGGASSSAGGSAPNGSTSTNGSSSYGAGNISSGSDNSNSGTTPSSPNGSSPNAMSPNGSGTPNGASGGQ
jgi:hypothetical protein